MSVLIGSARIDENNRITGGRYGDQTGYEVCTEPWYKHSQGWVVCRAKDPERREWIATAMEQACENDLIGYDQNYRNTLFNAAKEVGFCPAKITRACDTDCSALVRICCLYAEVNVPDFYTGNEVEVLGQTGKFEIIRDSEVCDSDRLLMRGDILVTRTQGHTAVVLSNGSGIHQEEEPSADVYSLAAAAQVITGDYDAFISYLADRAINGDFGNGEKRKQMLRGLYDDVRAEINRR